ncbi:MAG: PD-(D/E)XK nuclease family protein, partial [Clostridia bacterium]|nr:PD-(D/E)XK nuclease family protein [Clostridia bacterium]
IGNIQKNGRVETLKSTLGDEDTGLAVLREILTAGFSQKSIGIIPKVYDSVAFGDINRSVIKNVKALFLIGVNEGQFPTIPQTTGVLSDDEREYLIARGISVAPDAKKLIEASEFSLYESVNVAKDKLYVSYPIDNDGQGLRPAGLVSKIKRTFKNLKTESYLKDDILTPELSVSSLGSAYSYVLTHIKNLENNTLARTLCDELLKNEEYKEKVERAIKFSQYENNAGKLTPTTVSSLYGKNMTGSVSRFERFSSCPFSFFVEYGLRARERKVLKVESPDIGSLLHEVVERFSKVIHEKGLSFKTITKAEQKAICDEIIDEMFGAMMVKKVFSEGRINGLKIRLKSLVAKSVWAICEHVKRGEFEPAAFELSFDKNGDIEPVVVTLPTGEEITMIGRIDRIDTFCHEGKLYIKIIDYKSGNKVYSLSDIFNKTTLQLSVYMIAATENAKGKLGVGDATFGGMFYFKLDDPIEDGMPDSEQDDEKSLKAFKMSGLLADDETIVSAMDKGLASGWSCIIPVYKLKDGGLSKNQSKLADPEQYEKLKRYVKDAVTQIGKEIVSGNIDILPVKDGKFLPCSYCKYRVVCGYDPEIHPCRYTKTFSSDEEIWNEM